MSQTKTVIDVLDRDFLVIRQHVIDVAAALDRVDAAGGTEGINKDPRFLNLQNALNILNDGKPDRAQRVQMAFSDPYDANWRGR